MLFCGALFLNRHSNRTENFYSMELPYVRLLGDCDGFYYGAQLYDNNGSEHRRTFEEPLNYFRAIADIKESLETLGIEMKDVSIAEDICIQERLKPPIA